MTEDSSHFEGYCTRVTTCVVSVRYYILQVRIIEATEYMFRGCGGCTAFLFLFFGVKVNLFSGRYLLVFYVFSSLYCLPAMDVSGNVGYVDVDA